MQVFLFLFRHEKQDLNLIQLFQRYFYMSTQVDSMRFWFQLKEYVFNKQMNKMIYKDVKITK